MCAQCTATAATAAAAAGGIRAWLTARRAAWLTAGRLRALTVLLVTAALVASSVRIA